MRRIGSADVSFHPAGHVLGSAQIRIAHRGQTIVASGDYKLAPDPTCAPFEPVRCDTFLTESTFGLPIYRWDPPHATMAAILRWWEDNRAEGRTSVLFAYALGKAQRILAGLAAAADPLPGPLHVHGAIDRINRAYVAAGVALPPTRLVADAPEGTRWTDSLVLAPPSARGSRWMQRFEPAATAFASGWMALRGPRRRQALDRGFVLSDHADWPALATAIAGRAGARGMGDPWVPRRAGPLAQRDGAARPGARDALRRRSRRRNRRRRCVRAGSWHPRGGIRPGGRLSPFGGGDLPHPPSRGAHRRDGQKRGIIRG